jgi:hypothetical protein
MHMAVRGSWRIGVQCVVVMVMHVRVVVAHLHCHHIEQAMAHTALGHHGI